MTEMVTSADGTAIAYERSGAGPPVVVVGGALCARAQLRPLAAELASRFTVFNYDRRGRGESGDAAPYAVEREVEDLTAVIAAAGGTAAAYGHSSGAALILHAAAHGAPIDRLVVHEPPFSSGTEEERESSAAFAEQLAAVLADGRDGDAVELFLSTAGIPPEALAAMRDDPWWPEAVALAPTLAYDTAVIDNHAGGAVPVATIAGVTIPALVLAGGASPDWMLDAGRQVAEALPAGRHRILEGAGHDVEPAVLAPVVVAFLTE